MVFKAISTSIVSFMGLTGRPEKVLEFWIYDSLKITTIMFGMVLFIGFIRTYISPEKIREFLKGKRSITGYLLAALLGIVSPFCSCSTVPIFIGFSQTGIPLGMTLTFLFVSPMVNTAAVVILMSSLGLSSALVYITGGVLVGVTGGLTLSKFFTDQDSGKTQETSIHEEKLTPKERGSKALNEAKNLVSDILPYIIIGVGIGALIHGLVPSEIIKGYLGGSLAVPGAVLIGIPVYTNIIGVIPVVESLLGKGLHIGTSVAFMMSVTALSLPQFFMLKKVMKKKLLITYGATMATGIIIVGYLTNILL